MITQYDLVTEFGEEEIRRLSDHDGDGEINVVVVAKAIDKAVNKAKSYLHGAGLTTAMLTPTPDILKVYLCDIARFELAEDGTTEEIDKRYKLAFEWLERVMKNPRMLGDDYIAMLAKNNGNSRLSSGIVVAPNPKPDWTF